VRAGILVLDKPRGPTSHDAVAVVRRALRTGEVGHAGTLDPMATGVLIVAVGEATKLVPYLTLAEKEYEATVVVGQETDTLDAMGKLTRESAIDDDLRQGLSDAEPGPRIKAALWGERTRTSQVPPAFSAIQEGGVRAYTRARRGEDVVLPAREVRVHVLEVLAMRASPVPSLDVRIRADKGYYVRSLARDLAAALGTVGHLSALRRLASGSFTVTHAIPLGSPPEALAAHLVPLDDAAKRALPSAVLSESGLRDARFGRPIARSELSPIPLAGEPAAWLDAEGRLVAIGVADEEVGRVVRGFRARDE
jgi:tRNA pseudouridine55 synthase